MKRSKTQSVEVIKKRGKTGTKPKRDPLNTREARARRKADIDRFGNEQEAIKFHKKRYDEAFKKNKELDEKIRPLYKKMRDANDKALKEVTVEDEDGLHRLYSQSKEYKRIAREFTDAVTGELGKQSQKASSKLAEAEEPKKWWGDIFHKKK